MECKIYIKFSCFKFSNYYKPTPATVRKFADFLVVVTTTLSGSAILIGAHHYVVFAVFFTGALAKFVSNLLADDDKNKH